MSDRSTKSPQSTPRFPRFIVASSSRRSLLKDGAVLAVGLVGPGVNARTARAAPPNQLRAVNLRRQSELATAQVIRLPEGEPVHFDPGVTRGGRGLEQLQNLFEGLVFIDQRDGSLQMGVAEEMTVNDEQTEFTFTIRDGVTWSDGAPLNANDFEWSWKRVLDPATKSEYTTAMYPLKNAVAIDAGKGDIEELGVTATDERTLVVTLEGPTPYFPLLAATWTFYPVPRHVIEEAGEAWVEAGTMISNGPYKLTAWEHDQSMTLERNDNYYGEAPTITRAEYTLFDNHMVQALVAFEANELDQAQVTAADLGRVKNDPTLGPLMKGFPRSGTAFVVCDTTNPPTDDLHVRQALSLAIMREDLAHGVFKGEFSPAPTILPPDIPGYNPAAALGEDAAKAQELLAEAGFPDGAGFPEIALTYNIAYRDQATAAQYLQGVWKQALGIEVLLDPLEPKAFQDWFSSRQDQPYNLMVNAAGSDWRDPANWHNQLFDSQADFFNARWKNDEFDTLVREAVGMSDQQARIEHYEKAETLLNRDAPVIPLYNLNSVYVIKPYVLGIHHYSIVGRIWLRYVSILEH